MSLHQVFVHAVRARRDARPHIPQTEQLEHALNGAVFAEGAVQQGERHVEVVQVDEPVALDGRHPGAAGLAGQQHGGGARLAQPGQLVALLAQRTQLVGRHLNPTTRRGDADADHVEPVGVDGSADTAGGHARDVVFRAGTPEDDAHPNALRHASSCWSGAHATLVVAIAATTDATERFT